MLKTLTIQFYFVIGFRHTQFVKEQGPVLPRKAKKFTRPQEGTVATGFDKANNTEGSGGVA